MTKIKKIFKLFTMITIVIIGYYFYNLFSIYHYSKLSYSGKADAAIVLGAAAWGNNPSPVLKERLNHAINLYKNGRCKYLIFTGGKGFPGEPGESVISKRYAEKNGIPAKNILIENKSKNTIGNIKNTVKIADANNLKTFFLVSDPYHLKRASVIANYYKLIVHPSATPTSAFRSFKIKREFIVKETNLLILLNICLVIGINPEDYDLW